MFKKKKAIRPVINKSTYLKFGFVVTEHENYYCPRCKSVLNAGPDYQPRYCGQCGQKINFSKIEWKEDRELGFKKRGESYEPV